jgi:WD40 repeat protein
MSPPLPDDQSNTTSVTWENPWLGLASFEEKHSEQFYGRSAEIAEMENMVLRGPACLLFGRSGLGKTSLLRAGVFPRLRSKNCLPVYIRLNFADDAPPLVEQIKRELSKALDSYQITAPKPKPEESLWEYTHREDVDFWDSRVRLVIPVLVFDQFEEIFTLGKLSGTAEGKVAVLLEELQAIINNSPPEHVRKRFETHPEETGEFDFEKRTVKVLVGLREDYLAHFEALRKQFHGAGTNRMRLEPLNGRQALEAVLKPGKGLVDEDVAQQIIEFVAHEKYETTGESADSEQLDRRIVEPALLSVICRELNERRRKAKLPKITADLLSSAAKEEILLNFYEQAIGDRPEAARVFVEDHLLTGGGYRDRADQLDAIRGYGVPLDTLNILVSRHLLRREITNGVVWVELTHDLLTGVVQQSRTRRQQRQAEAGRRKAERTITNYRAVMGGVGVFAVVLICLAIALYNLQQKATNEANRVTIAIHESSKADLAIAEQLFDEDRWGRGIAYLGHSLSLNPTNAEAATHFWTAVVYGRHGDGRLPISESWHGFSRSASYAIFNPEGTVALIAADKNTSLDDVATGVPIWSRSNMVARIAAFSFDGQFFLTVNSATQEAQIWATNNSVRAVATLKGTPALPISAVFSPTTNWVLITGVDSKGNTAGIWDAATGSKICMLTNQNLLFVPSAAFSTNGQYVVTAGGTANNARVWDPRTGELLTELAGAKGHTDWVMSVAFDSAGNRIVTGSNDRTARIWNWRATNCVAVLRHNGKVNMAGFGAGDSRVITASADGTARIWDPSNGNRLADPMQHNSPVLMAAFSSINGLTRVVSRCADNTVHIWGWDAANVFPIGEPLQHGKNNRLYDAVLTGVAGSKIATCGAEGFGLWNITPSSTGRILQCRSKVWSARFSPDSKEIITASTDARVWNPEATEVESKTLGQRNDGGMSIRDVEFDPKGNRIVTSGPNDIANVWDAHSHELLGTLTGHTKYIRMAKFNSAGNRIVTASLDGTARIFNLDGEPPFGQVASHLQLVNGDGVLWAGFGSDDQLVATTSLDHTAKIWNATTGKRLAIIPNDDIVMCAAFSQDGRHLATACRDGTVHVATLISEGGNLRCEIKTNTLPNTSVNVVQFSPRDEFLAAGTEDGTIAIWNAGTSYHSEKRIISTHRDRINSLEFKDRPDGLLLVSASADRTTRLWKVTTNGPITAFCEPFPHNGEVLQASFSPDGHYVVTASEDRTAGLWKIPPSLDWGATMTNTLALGTNSLSIGDGLTEVISGFRFDANSGEIQQMQLRDRLALKENFETNAFITGSWRSLFLWWKTNSQQASEQHQPWPAD